MSYKDRVRCFVVAQLVYRTQRILAGMLVSYNVISVHEVALTSGDPSAIPLAALCLLRSGETHLASCCSDCHEYVRWKPDAEAR